MSLSNNLENSKVSLGKPEHLSVGTTSTISDTTSYVNRLLHDDIWIQNIMMNLHSIRDSISSIITVIQQSSISSNEESIMRLIKTLGIYKLSDRYRDAISTLYKLLHGEKITDEEIQRDGVIILAYISREISLTQDNLEKGKSLSHAEVLEESVKSKEQLLTWHQTYNDILTKIRDNPIFIGLNEGNIAEEIEMQNNLNLL